MSTELHINRKYMRENWDVDHGPVDKPEEGKCNYYEYRFQQRGSAVTVTADYIVQTYSVGPFGQTIGHMVAPSVADIPTHRKVGVSVHYIIAENGEVFQMVDDSKRAWANGRHIAPGPYFLWDEFASQ